MGAVKISKVEIRASSSVRSGELVVPARITIPTPPDMTYREAEAIERAVLNWLRQATAEIEVGP